MGDFLWIREIAIIAVVVIASSGAAPMEFEQFMSSLAKSDANAENVDAPSQQKDKDLAQFMRRSGLLENSNSQSSRYNQELLSALQALQKQQSLAVYPTENAQPSTLVTAQLTSPRESNSKLLYSSYQKPLSKDSTSVGYQQVAPVQALSQQRPYSPLSSDSSSQLRSASTNPVIPDSTNSLLYSTSQVSGTSNDKVALKDDRQGHYPYEAYDAGYDGNILHSRNPGGYEAESYGHEPAGYGKGLGIKFPVPQISIKFDPLGLLKLLLKGIPRPLFNLNGRIFLGLELGKGIGLAKGAGGHYGGHSGGGKIITIG